MQDRLHALVPAAVTPALMLTTLMLTTLMLTGPMLSGCGRKHAASGSRQSLAAARAGFATHLTRQTKTPDPVPASVPPGFEMVTYPAPLGPFPAIVAHAPADGVARHPAMVWIAGGFDNSIGDTPWAEASPDNDQSARAFYQAGIVTLYPSLRGGNGNPGHIEGLYGEVDDVLAAGRYLASRPDVDPKRVYLGGHSTGGTLALLVAESTPQFRAVFAFGPVGRIEQDGSDNLPFDLGDDKETALRSPILYLGAISSPTYVMEGTDGGNLRAAREMYSSCENPQVHFYQLPGYDHFSELAPVTPQIAAAIVKDTGPQPRFAFVSPGSKIQPIDQ